MSSRTESPVRSSSSLEKRSASMTLDDSKSSRSSKSREPIHIVSHANSTGNLTSDGNMSDSSERSRSSSSRKSQTRRTSRSTQRDATRSSSSHSLTHKSSTESLPTIDDVTPSSSQDQALAQLQAQGHIIFSEDNPSEIQSATLEGLTEYMQLQMSTAEQSSECPFILAHAATKVSKKPFCKAIHRTNHRNSPILHDNSGLVRHNYQNTNYVAFTSFFHESESVDSAIRQTRVFWALRTFIQYDRETLLQDPECRKVLKGFLDKLRAGDSQRQGYAAFLERAIKGASDEVVSPRARSSSSRGPSSKSTPADELPNLDILAQQMTRAEYRYFSAIKISDFFGSSWLKQSPHENATAASIEHSNLTSRWMATKILAQPTKQGRAKVIGKFIKLIDNLREMNNLSSMMTVYMSLQLHCISRLKKTWKTVPKALRQQFQRHEALLRPMSNFSGYREMMAKASLPCVPYIGITAKDIVALDELPTYEEGTQHINWYKMTQISKVLMDQVLRFKKADYHYQDAPDIFAEMMNPETIGLFDEDRLIEQSILVEPDDGSDKDRHAPKDAPSDSKREGSLSSPSAGAAAQATPPMADKSASPAKGSPRHDELSSDPFTVALIQALYNVYHRTLTSTGSLQAEDHSGELVTLTVDMLHLLSQLSSVSLRDEATKVVTLGTLFKQVCSVVTEMTSGRQRFLFESSLDYRSKVNIAPRVIALAALAFTFSASSEFGQGAGHRVFYLTSQDAGEGQLRIRAIVAQNPLVTGEISASASSAAQLLSLPLSPDTVPHTLSARLSPFLPIMKALNASVARVSDASAFAFTLNLSRSSGAVADTSKILTRLHGKDVKAWTVDDVCDWVVANSVIDSKWSSLFSSNDISGSELTTLSESDIVDMGIPRAHARIILKEITALSNRNQRSHSLPGGLVSSSSGNAINGNLADSRAESEASDSSSDVPASDWAFTVKCGTSAHRLVVSPGAGESRPSFDSLLAAIKSQLPPALGLDTSSKKRNFSVSYLDSEGDPIEVDTPPAFAKSCDYILEDSPEGGAFVLKLHATDKADAVPSAPAFDMADFLEKYKDSSEAVVLTKGDAANIQFINYAATRQFGLAMNALLDVPVEAVLVQPFEYYRELYSAQQLPANTVLLGSAGPINVRITLERIAGDHWVWSITPQHEVPAPQALSLSEHREKLSSERDPSVLISTGDLLIEAFNPPAIEIFQHQFEDVHNKPISVLMPQFQREVVELVKQADESVGKEATSGSLLCQRKDNSLFVAAMSVRQQTDTDGVRYYLVKFVVA